MKMILKGLIVILSLLSAAQCRSTIAPIMVTQPAQSDADMSDFMVQSMFSGLRQGIAQMFDTISSLASRTQVGGLSSNVFTNRLDAVRRDISGLFDAIAPISLMDDFIVPPSSDETQAPSPDEATTASSQGSNTETSTTSTDATTTQAATTPSNPQTTPPSSSETSTSAQTSTEAQTSTAAQTSTNAQSSTVAQTSTASQADSTTQQSQTTSSGASTTSIDVTSSDSRMTTESNQVVTTTSSGGAPPQNVTCPQGVYDQQQGIVRFTLESTLCDITIHISKPPKFMRDRARGKGKNGAGRTVDRYIDVSPQAGNDLATCPQARTQMYGRNTFVVETNECVMIVSRNRGRSRPPSIISRAVN